MPQQAAFLFTEVLNNPNLKRKCLGIAKNYFTEQVKKDPKLVMPPYPYIFSKTLSSLCPKGKSFTIPAHAERDSIYHEVELGIMLKSCGKHNTKDEWKKDIGAYFLSLDYTNFPLTKQLAAKGNPWFLSKAQDNFLYLSDMIPAHEIDDPHNVQLELKINGKLRQKDNTGNMYFKIYDQLDYITKYLSLEAGDILLTGTPEGMGPINEGDHLEAKLTYKGKVLATISDTIQREKL